MPRFTPATEAALLAAGWFEGRTVPNEQMRDWLVINWCPYDLPEGYSRISPKAWQALKEFGGLAIERGADGKPLFELNPLLVPDKINPAWRWDTIAWELGTDLFPLGTIEFNIEERTDAMSPFRGVFIGNDGRVFIQAHPVYCLGNNIDEAIERVVSGDRGEPIPGISSSETESMRSTKSINNTIRELIDHREKQLMQGFWPSQATTLGREKKGWALNLLKITDWDAEAKRVCRAFGIKDAVCVCWPA